MATDRTGPERKSRQGEASKRRRVDRTRGDLGILKPLLGESAQQFVHQSVENQEVVQKFVDHALRTLDVKTSFVEKDALGDVFCRFVERVTIFSTAKNVDLLAHGWFEKWLADFEAGIMKCHFISYFVYPFHLHLCCLQL
ncbi:MULTISPECIES: hypothetical protein [unclassified Variovorax]|uniref:hypothetical protein n=1 Tax=unclassified Variovorax TaxID=663243 RepID=UPI002576311D|nr:MULTISPECIES: hypothetical protein [unclassified Variovorax]MDM0086895.1 hypothetical protein [Variovorax sp. J22G40]MDM0144849.1 hypothetical protein [Variovorax sp. J2P1-31]